MGYVMNVTFKLNDQVSSTLNNIGNTGTKVIAGMEDNFVKVNSQISQTAKTTSQASASLEKLSGDTSGAAAQSRLLANAMAEEADKMRKTAQTAQLKADTTERMAEMARRRYNDVLKEIEAESKSEEGSKKVTQAMKDKAAAALTEAERLEKASAALRKKAEAADKAADAAQDNAQAALQAAQAEEKLNASATGVASAEKKVAEALNQVEHEAEEYTSATEKAAQADEKLLTSATEATSAEKKVAEALNKAEHEAEEYTSAAEKAAQAEEKLHTSASGTASAEKKVADALNKSEHEAEEYASAAGKAANESSKLGTQGESTAQMLETAFMALGVERVISGIKDAFVACSKASIEFESAITGVYKTVDGTDAQLTQISDDIKSMALEIPSTTTEIAGVAESAGQLGIATDDVTEFTEVMINLGEATNLSSDEAASSLAKFSNITGVSADKYENLGSTVVALGNNFATTEADIVAMATRMASAGTLAGLTESDILGLAAAMSSVGIEADAGGSAMSKLMTDIQVAVETGNDSLNDFASVAGMTTEQFSDLFENRAVDALNAFITGLNDVERNGQTATVILENMGITEVRLSNAVKSLASNSDGMTSAVKLAGEAWEENTALADEAGKRYGTLESRLAITKNAANNLKIAIGDALNPTVGAFADAGTDVLTWLTDFCEENPAVVTSISGVVGALTLAGTAVAGYTIAVKAADTMTKIFNTTLSAGKIFSVAGAVAAVGGVIGALAYKFTTAKDEVEDYNGTLEQCRNEIKSTETSYKNVCAMYGENSQAAQSLSSELDTLNKQYEKGGGIVEEYSQRLAESTERLNKLRTEYDNQLNDISNTETSGMIAVANLESLSEKAQLTNDDLDLMSHYADYLNDTFNCNIVVDYDTGKLTGFDPNDINSAMVEMSKENRKNASMDYLTSTDFQDSFQEKFKVYEEARHKKESYDASWRFQQVRTDLPQENENSVKDKFSTRYTSTSNIDIEGLNKEFRNAEKDLQSLYNEIYSEYEKMGYGIDEADMYIRSLKETAYGYDLIASAAEEATKSMTPEGAVSDAWKTYKDEITQLAEAYDEAYASIRTDLDGMFGLFEKASMNLEDTLSLDGAIENLDSQIGYFEQYKTALDELSKLGVNNDILEQLNPEQAAAFAEELGDLDVEAAKTKVDELNTTFDELSKAKDKTAETMTMIEEDFAQKLDDMQGKLEKAIDDMGLEDEAAKSAKNTMDGYINQLKSSGGSAVLEAQLIASRISTALSSTSVTIPKIQFPGFSSAKTTNVEANAVGTTYSDDVFMAGEDGPELIIGQKGSKVFPADETNRIISAVTEEKPFFVPPAESTTKNFIDKTETVSRREVAININGNGAIAATGGVDKEQVVEILFDYLKPALMNILSQDIFEEGDDSYEF